MARRRGPARWPLIVLLVVFAAGGIYSLVGRSGDDGSEPDEAAGPLIEEPLEVPIVDVEGDPAPIEVTRVAYAMTYRVEGFTPDKGAVIDTERRWVRPPFESRVETTAGEDDDGEVTFQQISAFGLLQTGRDEDEPAVLAAEPVVAPGEARITADFDSAVSAGVFVWQGQERTVLDRRCQVFRTGAPIDVADAGPPIESPLSYADLCIADDGLLLHEEWVIDGNVFRRRIATSLQVVEDHDDELFAPSGRRPAPPGDGILREVTRDSQPADVAFYSLVAPPEGFRHLGRFGHTPPRPELDFNQAEPTVVAQILDVYVDRRGGLLVVANGGTSDNTPFIVTGEDDVPVELGALGTGELLVGLRQHEVRVGLPRGRFVRVWGTLPVEELVAAAMDMTATTDPDGEVTEAR
jgi:hypothetical protein